MEQGGWSVRGKGCSKWGEGGWQEKEGGGGARARGRLMPSISYEWNVGVMVANHAETHAASYQPGF